MGGSSSKAKYLTTDDYVEQVRHVRTGMSDRDRYLYNFVKIKIAEEDIADCEITVDFQDQQPLVLYGGNNPSGRLYMGYDDGNNAQMIWEKRGFWRNFKRFWVGCFRYLRSALLHALRLAIEMELGAKGLGWY